MTVLKAIELTKTYGDLSAVNKLSLDVKEGEIYGFLGLNGAGKTTAIRMFLDLIRPTSGAVLLFGKKVSSGDELLNQVGYMVETPYSYPDLTVAENLQIYFCYRKLKDQRLIETVIHKLSLFKYRDVKAKHLSLGNKQRLGLAKALFHNPRLLILDEPTNGLDPAGIVEIRELLKTMSSEGCTIFVSSHILGEMAKQASRVGILHDGKLIREIETRNLESEIKKKLVIKTNDNQGALNILQSIGQSFLLDVNNDFIYSNEERAYSSSEVIADKLVTSGIGLSQMFIQGEDLESYFLRQIERQNSL